VAFPQVSDADTQNGTVTSASTSWSLTYPTNLANGDLILLFFALNDVQTPSLPAGWVVDYGTNSPVLQGIGKKKSDGSETGTFTLSITGAVTGAWRVFRITGWEGTLGTAGGNFSSSGAVPEATGSGTSTTPDPPSLNPNNWGTENTLWFAVAGADASPSFSGFPASYTNTSSDVPGGSAPSMGIARRELTAASENPGTFTVSTSSAWICLTAAVRPASSSLSRTATDAPTTSVSVARIGTFGRTSTEAPHTAESAQRGSFKTATDAPTTADVATRVGTFVLVATEAPTISEAATSSKVSASIVHHNVRGAGFPKSRAWR